MRAFFCIIIELSVFSPFSLAFWLKGRLRQPLLLDKIILRIIFVLPSLAHHNNFRVLESYHFLPYTIQGVVLII